VPIVDGCATTVTRSPVLGSPTSFVAVVTWTRKSGPIIPAAGPIVQFAIGQGAGVVRQVIPVGVIDFTIPLSVMVGTAPLFTIEIAV